MDNEGMSRQEAEREADKTIKQVNKMGTYVTHTKTKSVEAPVTKVASKPTQADMDARFEKWRKNREEAHHVEESTPIMPHVTVVNPPSEHIHFKFVDTPDGVIKVKIPLPSWEQVKEFEHKEQAILAAKYAEERARAEKYYHDVVRPKIREIKGDLENEADNAIEFNDYVVKPEVEYETNRYGTFVLAETGKVAGDLNVRYIDSQLQKLEAEHQSLVNKANNIRLDENDPNLATMSIQKQRYLESIRMQIAKDYAKEQNLNERKAALLEAYEVDAEAAATTRPFGARPREEVLGLNRAQQDISDAKNRHEAYVNSFLPRNTLVGQYRKSRENP
jgi:hypothetical protein